MRANGTGVWTGSEVFVWGGFDDLGVLPPDGALYDPSADRWRAVSSANAPAPRSDVTAVWTGREVLFWGGATVDMPGPFPSRVPLDTGGRYRPDTNEWRTVESAESLAARYAHGVAWTGSELFVWGGAGALRPLSSGARLRL